jgi:hypothetical protein
MLAFISLGLVVGLQLGIILDCHAGRVPEGMTQTRRTSFTHFGFWGLILPSLIDRGVNAGIGN